VSSPPAPKRHVSTGHRGHRVRCQGPRHHWVHLCIWASLRCMRTLGPLACGPLWYSFICGLSRRACVSLLDARSRLCRASLCVTAFLRFLITWCSRSRRYLRGCVTIFKKDSRDVRGPPHLTHTGEFEAVLSLGRKTLRTSCGRWSAEAHLQARATHQRAPRALCRLRPPRGRLLYHTFVRVRR